MALVATSMESGLQAIKRDLRISLRLSTPSLGIFAIFLLNLFFPPFRNLFASTGDIGVVAVTVLAGTIYIGIRRAYLTANLATRMFLLLGLVFFLVMLTHTILATILFSQDLIARDLFEVYKPSLGLLGFVLSFVYFQQTKKNFYNFDVILGAIFFSLILVQVIQKEEILWISELYTKLVVIKGNRISIPFFNPYDCAFFMSFFVFYYAWTYLILGNISRLLMLSIATAAVLGTQSRTGTISCFLTLLLGLPFSVFLSYTSKSIHIGSLMRFFFLAGMGICAAILIVFQFPHVFPYLGDGIASIIEKGQNDSLGERLRQFFAVVQYSEDSIINGLFGNGVSKSIYSQNSLESAYSVYIFRYGILGLLFFFIGPIVVTLGLFLIILPRVKNDFYTTPISLWVLSNLIAGCGNSSSDRSKIILFYFFAIGTLFNILVYLIDEWKENGQSNSIDLLKRE